ncbi:hypothetical protein OROMI_002717 [Orobanche minor]
MGRLRKRNDKRVDNVPFTTIRVCDRIWKFIHSINLKGKIKRIFWKGADKIAFVAGTTPAPRPIYSMVAVRWIKPTVGWWKLNTDGAALGSPGVAAAGGGGVIRDHLGHPLLMFSEFLGVQTNNYAEIYAIWRGLEFCIDQNFTKVWVEVDSKIALHLIEHSKTCHW